MKELTVVESVNFDDHSWGPDVRDRNDLNLEPEWGEVAGLSIESEYRVHDGMLMGTVFSRLRNHQGEVWNGDFIAFFFSWMTEGSRTQHPFRRIECFVHEQFLGDRELVAKSLAAALERDGLSAKPFFVAWSRYEDGGSQWEGQDQIWNR